jgi:hypothetical protein
MKSIDKTQYEELTDEQKLAVLRLPANDIRLNVAATAANVKIHHRRLSEMALLELGRVFFEKNAGWPKVLMCPDFHAVVDEAFRNRFTVMAGHHRDVGDAASGPKLDTYYTFSRDYETLSEALNIGLPHVKGSAVIELTYVDLNGVRWELDAVQSKEQG